MSCLFRALAVFVQEPNSNIIRQKICNYIALKKPFPYVKSEDYIQWESGLDSNTYVSKMRHPAIWGGAVEIQAFCELYNFCIFCECIKANKKSIITFIPHTGGCMRRAKLTWNGDHYEPVIQKK